ncbi:hypothetical protein IAU59_000755 [Kwoniella sp. CBS 9459]
MTVSPSPSPGSDPSSGSTKSSNRHGTHPATAEDSFSFKGLPSFDSAKFQPPSWANDSFFTRKNGESSKSKHEPADPSADLNTDDGRASRPKPPQSSTNRSSTFGLEDNEDGVTEHFSGEDDDLEEDDENEEVWSDAKSVIEPEEARFTLTELKELLSRAVGFKEAGNQSFTSKPPKYEEAVQSYKSAIDYLPNVDPPKSARNLNPGAEGSETATHRDSNKISDLDGSGIQEVTDEEAALIEREMQDQQDPDVVERKAVEDEIRETTKACWGNLAACHIALKEDTKAVEACTEALKIDPKYVKGLHRRATANERIGSLTALSSAKDDYTTLQTLLPASSPLHPTIRRSLSTLPERIKVAEKESMDEMMGKLKDLGNMFLGNFGLSTNNFKFEKGDGGGYNMQFQR